MLKARSRKLSLVLILAMLMTMFVGVGTANAAAIEYSAFSVPTIDTENVFGKTLGSILVEIDNVKYLGSGANWVTLKMPDGVKLLKSGETKDGVTGPSVKVEDVTGAVYAKAFVKNSSTVDIMVMATGTGEGEFSIHFENVKVQSGSGNLDVTFLPQSGSAMPGGTLTIANIVSKGATQAMVSSVKSLGEGVGQIDTISIAELSPGVFKDTGTIEIELPDGVKWVDPSDVSVIGSWAFSDIGYNGSPLLTFDDPNTDKVEGLVALRLNKDKDILYVDILQPLNADKAGRIDIGGRDDIFLEIDIDEDDAKKGEIKAKVSSDDIDGVTKQDLVIAKYGDYDTTITANETTELIAGHDEQELGSFYIEEELAGSLVAGRTIVLKLPSGVKWNKAPELTVEKGSISYDSEIDLSANKARITIDEFSTDAAKILVEEGEVYVEPNFEGDVEIEVSGTAGVDGTVKVAEAVKAVEVTASEVPNIIIGEQNVATGDIVIKETVAGAIQEGDIVIELAGGYEFYKEPTVKVTEGDLKIDDVDINSDQQLVITIDKDSDEASTITISNIYVTGYRYAPTGPVVAKIVEAEGEEKTDNDGKKYVDAEGSTALDSLYAKPGSSDNPKYSEKSVGEVIIANCITPAEAAATAEFKIGSNIFYVNGIAKVMDVAPYIKNDRTYMPMRYVGEEVLGAEVVWDSTARTVTLTKGDTTVVFTIGSTTYTVNGETKTADVAPEIANDRTMLPARYVAEAFGAIVGWDALTQTVLIQQ